MKPNTEQGTQKVEETTRTYQTLPTAFVIDTAIADARLLQKEGKTEAALEKWRSLANIVEAIDTEVAAHAWFSIGTLLREQDKKKKALAAYDTAIQLNPVYAEAYTQRGKIKDALNQHTAAIADFDEAIRLNPSDAEAYTNRGACTDETWQK